MIKVKFKSSISTTIGSFARGNVVVLPPEVAKPWIDQGICEESKEGTTEGVRVSAPAAPVAPSNPVVPPVAPVVATSKPAQPSKPAKLAKK